MKKRYSVILITEGQRFVTAENMIEAIECEEELFPDDAVISVTFCGWDNSQTSQEKNK